MVRNLEDAKDNALEALYHPQWEMDRMCVKRLVVKGQRKHEGVA